MRLSCLCILGIAFLVPQAVTAYAPYWLDVNGTQRVEAELEASKIYCLAAADEAYLEYLRNQESGWGAAVNPVVVGIRISAATKVKERAFYGCMAREGWSLVNN